MTENGRPDAPLDETTSASHFRFLTTDTNTTSSFLFIHSRTQKRLNAGSRWSQPVAASILSRSHTPARDGTTTRLLHKQLLSDRLLTQRNCSHYAMSPHLLLAVADYFLTYSPSLHPHHLSSHFDSPCLGHSRDTNTYTRTRGCPHLFNQFNHRSTPGSLSFTPL